MLFCASMLSVNLTKTSDFIYVGRNVNREYMQMHMNLNQGSVIVSSPIPHANMNESMSYSGEKWDQFTSFSIISVSQFVSVLPDTRNQSITVSVDDRNCTVSNSTESRNQSGIGLADTRNQSTSISAINVTRSTPIEVVNSTKQPDVPKMPKPALIPSRTQSPVPVREGKADLPKNSSISHLKVPLKDKVVPTKSSICSDYTTYLKTVTHDIRKPFLVSVDVYLINKSLIFYIVINTMHLENYKSEQHSFYTLRFSNRNFFNLFNRRNTDTGYSVLKYTVPITIPYREGDVIEFSLIDHKRHHPYNNIKACIRIPNPHPSPMGVCAYVSDYNSIDELRFWISYYRVQKVSMVIFYVATPMPQLVTEFSSLIHSGYLRLVDFTWPRHIRGWAIQCSNQQAQINSCYYHFKYEVQSLILCDTDEFVYSERYPNNLPALNSYISQTYPSYNVIHVFILLILNHRWSLICIGIRKVTSVRDKGIFIVVLYSMLINGEMDSKSQVAEK